MKAPLTRNPTRLASIALASGKIVGRYFRTSVDAGLEIINALRGHTTGYATPMFVIDAPGGGGKILMAPDSVVGRDGDDLLLRNFEGKVYRYPDPDGTLGRARVALAAE